MACDRLFCRVFLARFIIIDCSRQAKTICPLYAFYGYHWIQRSIVLFVPVLQRKLLMITLKFWWWHALPSSDDKDMLINIADDWMGLDNVTHYSCLLLLNYYYYVCCTDATMLFTQKRYHITIFSLQWFTKHKLCNFCNWDFACDPRQCNQEQTTFLTWNWIQKQKILHTLREWILQYLLAYNLVAPFAGGGRVCQSLIAQISLSLSPQ